MIGVFTIVLLVLFILLAICLNWFCFAGIIIPNMLKYSAVARVRAFPNGFLFPRHVGCSLSQTYTRNPLNSGVFSPYITRFNGVYIPLLKGDCHDITTFKMDE